MQYPGFVLLLGALVACGDNYEPAFNSDACSPRAWYGDGDADGVGNAQTGVISACVQPMGYAATASDCNDADPAVFTGAVDTCGDGVDQDCDGGDPLCSAQLDGWTITSSRIVPGATSDLITGTLTFTKLSGTADTRGGGACFVADLVGRGIGAATCTVDSDCTTTIVGGYGYCASPDGSGEAKRCWTRPGAGFCIRGSANTPGEKAMPQVTWDVGAAGTPVRWMILGCLAEEATPLACGVTTEVKYVRSLGPASLRM
ncbi:MAG: putative metal-binding motif-containing protein [Deltaproteobacteria bacterium]|nr:putative metal-binding motif-containing protein [Deltaproteobacteria bacterium]